MRQESLSTRLYITPAYYELARAVSYGGVRTKALKAVLEELSQKYGAGLVRKAFYELLIEDAQTGLTTLRSYVRKLCSQLLGPPPESPDYEFYWEGRVKPANHQPPKLVIGRGQPTPPSTPKDEPEASEGQPPSAEKPTMGEPGISPDSYARMAKEKNRRALHCMLRDARKKLKHNGKRSFSGKEAKKEVAAAEAELRARGLDVPPEGQETAAWDKPGKSTA
jgi:hypothetical protein